MSATFTPSYRGGSGPPLVCLHGFTDTWRTWELVLPLLEPFHDVLAPTLLGHAGGPPVNGAVSDAAIADEVERAMDAAGFETAHIVGNSLGGYIALQLAARGRASSVVALAPGGGWAPGDQSFRSLLMYFGNTQKSLQSSLPYLDMLLATADGRRAATYFITANFEHIPRELLAHIVGGVAGCSGASALIEQALRDGWHLDAERVTCPVRIVWGTGDQLLAWPSSAARYREDWLPHADWVVLDGVGHCPQLDIPAQTAELILGFTAR